MRYSINQVSWGISIVVHLVLLIILFKDPVLNKIKIQNDNVTTVKVQLYKPPQPKVKSKKVISVKGKKLPIKKAKPTSMPGDRKQPETSQTVEPVYPKSALNNEWEGTVKVKVTVTASGKPLRIDIISSSGYPSLDNAFIRAIKSGYHFKPKRVMGKNILGTIKLSHKFSIGGE